MTKSDKLSSGKNAMLYHNVRVTAHVLRFIDAIALAGPSLAAWFAGANAGLWPVESWHAALVFAAAQMVAFVMLASRLRVYHPRRTEDLPVELFVLFEVALYATGVGAFAALAFANGVSAPASLWGFVAGASVLLGLRVAMRLAIRRARRLGGDERVWLVVGCNARAAEIAAEVLRNPHYGIRIEEVVDVAGGEACNTPMPEGVKLSVLPDVDAFRKLVSTRVIDEVVVTLPMRSRYDTISRILEMCSDAGISVKLRPEAFETSGYSTEVSLVGSIPMVTHYNGPANYGHLFLKRVVDVFGSAAGLLLLFPFFVVVGLLVKLDSPGPVFFRQTRVGLHGRHFEMVKFRSMVKDAPKLREAGAVTNERDGTAFKIRNDSRITRVGRWLRKYHVDELPQLWNVLVGDMSLVGPRPLPVKEAHGNEWWQRRRLTMPPGLTCLWQLEDDPKIPFREWMELDMRYIDSWSLWLDFKLIARTFATVLRGNGW